MPGSDLSAPPKLGPGGYHRPATSVAIVSVPHSGTNALAKHLGVWNLRAPPQGATENDPVVFGHIWGRPVKQGFNFAADWLPLLAGRKVYMPVRDPEQLAWSWLNVHRQTLDKLRLCLTGAVDLLAHCEVRRVDIRNIAPANVKGPGLRDPDNGAALLRDFPTYFEGAY